MNRRRKIHRYQWEFMRRSAEYLEAYKLAMEIRDTARPQWEDPRVEVSDWRFMYKTTPQYQEEQKIAEAFGLTWMHDPSLTYDEIAGQDIFRLSIPEKRSYYEDEIDSHGIVTRMGSRNWMTIEIDFNKVNSIEALKDEIGFRLRAHWNLYCEHNTGHEGANLHDFDRIIMAGDLKRKGFSRRAIAEKIFPGTKDIAAEERKVTNDLNRYQEFTSGGWRKLTYP